MIILKRKQRKVKIVEIEHQKVMMLNDRLLFDTIKIQNKIDVEGCDYKNCKKNKK